MKINIQQTFILLITLTILFFTSCQDVIEIELNTTDPKLVVEGEINDIAQECTIKLSKTGDYFATSNSPAVSDAIITITGENIGTLNFEEIETGTYKIAHFQAIENILYTLKILLEDEEYTAEVTIPQKINLDSISFMPTPPSPHFDGGLMVNCHFADPVEFTNYYRIKAYKIGDPEKGMGSFAVYDDIIMNGNTTALPYMQEVFQPFDTIVVELLNLDKTTYDFYNTLSDIAGSSGGPPMGGSTPANPETNLTNNALGYFGAYSLCKDTIVILF